MSEKCEGLPWNDNEALAEHLLQLIHEALR